MALSVIDIDECCDCDGSRGRSSWFKIVSVAGVSVFLLLAEVGGGGRWLDWLVEEVNLEEL